MPPNISAKLRPWKTTRFILAGTLAGIFLISGCTNASPSPSPAASSSTKSPVASAASSPTGQLQPCSLVTKAEVETALGKTVNEPTTKQTQEFNYCEYSTTDGKTKFSIVMVNLTTDAKTYFENAKVGASLTVDVSGIGDGAFSFSNELWVLKGNNVISFQGGLMPEDAATLDLAKTLMTKAAGRV